MISSILKENLNNASWIRRMFVEGAKMKEERGEENVYDYSLGNPYFEPPKSVLDTLKQVAISEAVGTHRYMDNAGYKECRNRIAQEVSKEMLQPISWENILMTVGAAGGLNVLLRTILEPGDEVIIFAPYFAEYLFYIQNHNGVARILTCDASTFEPDVSQLKSAINEKTKAIIINTPNNPSGAVYSEAVLREMAVVINEAEHTQGRPIYLISDEPYGSIVYDGVKVPHVHNIFRHSVIVNSYSKSLGLAGERIGYIAINNGFEEQELFMKGLAFCNRTLGFVNAPAIWQRVLSQASNETVDISLYAMRREALMKVLREAGFEFVEPQGAFYLFPKAFEDDDIAFVMRAKEYGLLLVPGSGFGYPGYVRLSYCVDTAMIERSAKSFKELARSYGK